MPTIKRPSKISTKVPTPRANPLGARRNPRGFLPGPRPQRPKQNTRVYTKQTLQEDPSQFTNLGFGSNLNITGDM